jgi:hypothetical protein
MRNGQVKTCAMTIPFSYKSIADEGIGEEESDKRKQNQENRRTPRRQRMFPTKKIAAIPGTNRRTRGKKTARTVKSVGERSGRKSISSRKRISLSS